MKGNENVFISTFFFSINVV